jgi:hypothetical protein
MTKAQLLFAETHQRDGEGVIKKPFLPTPIDRILQKLTQMELPAKEHLEGYMRHK